MYSSRTSVEILEVWDKISLLIHKNSVATAVIMRFTKCSQSWIVSKEAGIARHRRAKNSKLSIQSSAKLSAKRFYMLCCNCLITTEISISNPYSSPFLASVVFWKAFAHVATPSGSLIGFECIYLHLLVGKQKIVGVTWQYISMSTHVNMFCTNLCTSPKLE